jgi:deoxyribonuclease-4
MAVGAEIGATGVVFHAGSHKGRGFDAVIGPAAAALSEVLEASPPGPFLLVENSAGMGAHLGASFEELGEMISRVGSDRLKVCLDTEHCFAAGYDIASPDAIDAAMDEFDRHIGLDRLVVVHANDAKVELGSGVDRHDNIGDGHIGIEGFEVIMAHDAFRDVPFILEVPGPDKKGPDKDNVDRLKSIRSRLPTPA